MQDQKDLYRETKLNATARKLGYISAIDQACKLVAAAFPKAEIEEISYFARSAVQLAIKNNDAIDYVVAHHNDIYSDKFLSEVMKSEEKPLTNTELSIKLSREIGSNWPADDKPKIETVFEAIARIAKSGRTVKLQGDNEKGIYEVEEFDENIEIISEDDVFVGGFFFDELKNKGAEFTDPALINLLDDHYKFEKIHKLSERLTHDEENEILKAVDAQKTAAKSKTAELDR